MIRLPLDNFGRNLENSGRSPENVGRLVETAGHSSKTDDLLPESARRHLMSLDRCLVLFHQYLVDADRMGATASRRTTPSDRFLIYDD